MGFQTTHTRAPAVGAAGRQVQGFDPALLVSAECSGAIPWGRGAIQLYDVGSSTDDDDDEAQLPVNFPAADVDAIIAGGVSTAGIQTYVPDGAAALDLDGAPNAHRRSSYGRPVQVVFNNHTDWDATTMQIWGFDTLGHPAYDEIVIPNGGNATVLALMGTPFAQISRVVVPAQTGTNGTFTLGYQGAAAPEQTIELYGVSVLVDANTESTTGYALGDMGTFLRRGRIWVTVENAVARGQVAYLRHTSDGGSNTALGTWRGNWDAGRAAAVLNARFATAAGAAGLSQLEVF